MRLVIVSNRLPITVVEKAGKLTFQRGAGGLVSGLSGYLDYLRSSSSTKEYIWVGWPGIAVADEMREELKSRALSEFQAYPVFIPEKSMEEFYLGFCNKIIWPLFHYFPSYAAYDESYWRRYKSVNETFRDAIMKIIKPDDVVWIHDYHLMLLPKLIRERMPDVPIGFFLHIPFPSYEIFRLLPGKWRREILMGLLGADFIG
ncbi:MAG TPA: trehalose-6-phosphate synthase, partial [Candidatus Avalokitesvara rifleensis]|uniref:trehalose-6-phosphate synthase n=1 Tax=Candidatus Avalokitesvara rifleensis TaxID=3367620 RepID=UPI0040257782